MLLFCLQLSAENELSPPPFSATADDTAQASVSSRFSALEYQQHVLRGLAPLLGKSHEKGFVVAEDDILNRLAQYKIVFPTHAINRKLIVDELLIEQYLQTAYNLAPPDHVIDKIFDKLQGLAGSRRLNRESLRPLLRSHGLLMHPQVLADCAELNLSARAEAMQKEAAENKPWPQELVQIPGDASECLAYVRSPSECLITVAQLNSMLGITQPSHAIAIDSARLAALRLILENHFYVAKAEHEGFGSSAELDERLEEMIQLDLLTSRLRRFGPPISDEGYLAYVYDKYYHEYFSRRTIPYVYLWGSSDSMAIEALHDTLSRRAAGHSQGTASTDRSYPILFAQPMGPFCLDSLPVALHHACDTLAPGEMSQPYHAAFGSYIFVMDSVAVRRGTSFHDAKLRLIYLATRERWLNPDSVCRAHALEEFTSNPQRFRSPDTLFLLCRLTTHNTADTLMRSDTAQPAPRTLLSTDLPPPIRIALELAFKAAAADKRRLFVSTLLGRFACEVDSIHPGGKPLRFKDVEHRLVEEYRRREFADADFEPAQPDAVRQRVYRGHAYSQLYQAALWERIQLNTVSNDTADSGDAADCPTAEERALEQLANEFGAWFNSLSINKNALFRKQSRTRQ